MRDIGDDLDRPVFLERPGGLAERAGGVDEIIDQHAGLAADVADDVHDLRLVGARTAFVDDREVGFVELLGERTGANHAAHVRRDDDDVLVFLPPDVAEQHRAGVDVVDGDIEEALDLVGVQVDGQHAVGAAFTDHVGDDLGADRHARAARPAILTRVTEVGDDGGHAPGAGALEGIEQHQQFHDVLVGRRAGWLDDEDIAAADVLENFDLDFAVRKAAEMHLAERHVQVVGDVVGQRRIGAAGEQHQLRGGVGHRCGCRLGSRYGSVGGPQEQHSERLWAPAFAGALDFPDADATRIRKI